MAGDTDDRIIAEQFSRGPNIAITLAQVYALGAGFQGQLGIIVYQQGYPVGSTQQGEFRGDALLVFPGCGLAAVLQQGDARLQRQLDSLQ